MDKNSKYEARVREIAEEMAAEMLGVTLHEFKEVWDTDALHVKYIPAARIAVKHMAEAFSDGCVAFSVGAGPYGEFDVVQSALDRGLIPSPEQRKEAGGV